MINPLLRNNAQITHFESKNLQKYRKEHGVVEWDRFKDEYHQKGEMLKDTNRSTNRGFVHHSLIM